MHWRCSMKIIAEFCFSYAKEVVRGEVDQVTSPEEKAVLEKAVSEREKLSSK